MEEMFQEAATEGMEVDPVSGNDIPEGVSGKNVRDDVDAKLSEGEFVIPAHAVKHFGVDFFETLIEKAEDTSSEVEPEVEPEVESDDTLIPEMSQGGLVPSAGLKEPTGADTLISQGNLTKVDSKGKPTQGNVKGYASGGSVKKDEEDNGFGLGNYNPSKYTSEWNAKDYGMGFSTGSDYMPNSDQKKNNKPKVQCPEGFRYDEKLKICVVNPSATKDNKPETEPRTGDDRAGTVGNTGVDSRYDGSVNTGGSSGSSWTSKFDYSDTDKLVQDTLTTLGSSTKSESETGSGSRLDGIFSDITQRFSGNGIAKGLGVAATALSPFAGVAVKGITTATAMTKASVANANAQYLDDQGLTDQAQTIRDAVAKYAEDNKLNRTGILKSDYSGVKRYANALESGSFQTTATSTPSTTANTVNERVGEGDGSSLNGGYNAGGFNNQGKSRAESGYSEASGGYDNNGKSGGSSVGSSGRSPGSSMDSGDDDNANAQNGAFNKGGLVTKPKKRSYTKKSKSKVNSKKGLGRKTK